VSGTVLSGSVQRDDTVELIPWGKEAKVRFVEVHHQRVEQALAAQRVGLNLQNIPPREVGVGTVLAAPGTLRTASLLNAELSLLPTVRRPIRNRQRIKVYVGTHCSTALLVTLEQELLHAGETGLVQLRLQESLAVLPGDPFVISPMNVHCVIGGGKILETSREKFRTAKAEKTLAYLQLLQTEDVKSIVRLYLSRFPNRPVPAEEVASATGFPTEAIQTVIKSMLRAGKLLHFEDRGYFDKGRYEALKIQVTNITGKILSKGAFKITASTDEIRFRLDPNLDDAPFQRMLHELCGEGKLVKADAGYRLPMLAATPVLQRGRLARMLTEFTKKQHYATFSAGTFWELYGDGISFREVKKIIDHLHAEKKLVRLNDGRYMATEAMQEIQEKVKELILRRGSLSIQDSREILGYGRTRAVPVLDYLDSIGLTCRMGEVRVLRSDQPLKPRQAGI